MMIDTKKYLPSIEVVQARREAILAAAREAQANQEVQNNSNIEQLPTTLVPAHGFPIVLVTANHTLSR